jgi:hypothetical protein
MPTSVPKGIAACLLAASALSALGCVENNVSIFIRGVTKEERDEDCIVTPGVDTVLLLRGALDKGYGGGYLAALVVGNQLMARGDADTLKPESNRVQFHKVEVEVFDFFGNSLGFTEQPVSGFAEHAQQTDPGYGVVKAVLIEPAIAALVNTTAGPTTVVARTQVFGRSIGGIEVETGLWDYPIDVCAGCLTTFPNGCQKLKCEDEKLNPCRRGQDDPLDCREVAPPNATSCDA